jgi:trehalose utilization protein
MYVNPLNAPPPDQKVLEGSWEGGERQGSDGLIWFLGRGKIFYFRPGHETRPIYYQPEVQQVLRNAIPWLAKPNRSGT